jgi:hypothetical protein
MVINEGRGMKKLVLGLVVLAATLVLAAGASARIAVEEDPGSGGGTQVLCGASNSGSVLYFHGQVSGWQHYQCQYRTGYACWSTIKQAHSWTGIYVGNATEWTIAIYMWYPVDNPAQFDYNGNNEFCYGT